MKANFHLSVQSDGLYTDSHFWPAGFPVCVVFAHKSTTTSTAAAQVYAAVNVLRKSFPQDVIIYSVFFFSHCVGCVQKRRQSRQQGGGLNIREKLNEAKWNKRHSRWSGGSSYLVVPLHVIIFELPNRQPH